MESLEHRLIEEEQAQQEYKADVLALRKKADMFPEEMDDPEWSLLIEDELSSGPKSIDELCRCLALPFYRISQLIVALKLAGRVTDQGGKFSLTIC